MNLGHDGIMIIITEQNFKTFKNPDKLIHNSVLKIKEAVKLLEPFPPHPPFFIFARNQHL